MFRTRPTALLFSENFFKVVFITLPPLLQSPRCPAQLPPPSPTVSPIHPFGLTLKGAANNSIINLSVSAQNCNSLNLTTNIHSYVLKLAAIKDLNTDIIFLSDTRLVSKKGISGVNRLRTSLQDAKGKKYDLFANSSTNSRGVAILADSNLNLVPVRTYSSFIHSFNSTLLQNKDDFYIYTSRY